MSSIDRIFSPAACKADTALSRPLPGPLMRTSTSVRPNFLAFWATYSAARPAANGVLLREPLNPPTDPADSLHNTSPLVSVIVTRVLLNDALMWTMPRDTCRLIFLLLRDWAMCFQISSSDGRAVIIASP